VLIRDIYRLFINRTDCYLGWLNHWRLNRQPVTPSLLARALVEPVALSLLAVNRVGYARWTCWDIDDDLQIPLSTMRSAPVKPVML
jgi:hypothetical protein